MAQKKLVAIFMAIMLAMSVLPFGMVSVAEQPVEEIPATEEVLVEELSSVEVSPDAAEEHSVQDAPVIVEETPAVQEIVPEEVSPVEEVPVEETPAEETPVEEAPVEATPVEETPAEETPVEVTPVEEAPVEVTPVEEAPVEEIPVEETPIEETPAEETPAEETPVEVTPVEEAPVEEAPVEEAPVEETPAEEGPVVTDEDVPSEEITEQQDDEPIPLLGVILADTILYDTPQGHELAVIPAGTLVSVWDIGGNWAKITVYNQTGYVQGNRVSLSYDPEMFKDTSAEEESPAEEITEKEAPVSEEVPTEETPVPEEAPAKETDVKETVAEESPATEEAPAVEEVPIMEALIEEVPAEETVTEDAPVTDAAPANDTPEETAPAAEEIPEESYTEYPDGLSGIVLIEDMLYVAPGGEALSPLNSGMQVMILAIGETWSKVCIDDTVGYIPTERLSLYNESEEVEKPIRSINLTANTRGKEILQIGMLVTISAELNGFENDTYILQWQYSPDRGATAIDIPGANDMAYSYYLSRQNAEYVYRLVVYVQKNN